MKKILFTVLVILATAVVVVGSPVQSMLGKRSVGLLESDEPNIPTLYTTDRLIALWDGIENYGFGLHDDTTALWLDCIYGHEMNLLSRSFIGEDCIYSKTSDFTSGKEMGVCEPGIASPLGDVLESGCFSMEICRTVDDSRGASYIDISLKNTGGGNLLFLSTSGMYNGSSSSWVNAGPGYTWLSRNTLQYRTATISFLVNGTTVLIYIDGKYNSSKTLSGPISPSKISIGQAVCHIYSIRFYSKILTSSEMLNNYLVDCERFNLP